MSLHLHVFLVPFLYIDFVTLKAMGIVCNHMDIGIRSDISLLLENIGFRVVNNLFLR